MSVFHQREIEKNDRQKEREEQKKGDSGQNKAPVYKNHLLDVKCASMRLRESDWKTERERKETERKIKWRKERKRGRGTKGLGFPCLSLLQSNQGNDAGTGDDTTQTGMHHQSNAVAPSHHPVFFKSPTAARLRRSLPCFLLFFGQVPPLSQSHSFPVLPSLSSFPQPIISFSRPLFLHHYTHLSFITSAFCRTTSCKWIVYVCVCACVCTVCVSVCVYLVLH